MAVKGTKMAVVLGWSGSEGLWGPGNTERKTKNRSTFHILRTQKKLMTAQRQNLLTISI
jgi:hypothetical protein